MQNYSTTVVQYEPYKHQSTGENCYKAFNLFMIPDSKNIFKYIVLNSRFFFFFLNHPSASFLFSSGSSILLLQLSQKVLLQRTNVKLSIRSFTSLYKRKGKQPTVSSSPSPTNACEYKHLRFKICSLRLLSHVSLKGVQLKSTASVNLLFLLTTTRSRKEVR